MNANEVIDQAALEVVKQWLALIDAGDWKESFNQSSPLFKSDLQTATSFRRGMSEHEWGFSVTHLQAQLGKAVSRDLKAARHAEGFPDEPVAEHLTLEYDTRFERNNHAAETVTVTADPDGRWRVSGYHIVLGSSPKFRTAGNPN